MAPGSEECGTVVCVCGGRWLEFGGAVNDLQTSEPLLDMWKMWAQSTAEDTGVTDVIRTPTVHEAKRGDIYTESDFEV